MNAPIDTLAFAERFESAGFGHDQARVLAAAFGQAQDGAREGLVTKADLDLSLSELEGRLAKQFGDLESRTNKQFSDFETRMNKQLGDFETRMTKQFGDLEVRLTRHVAEVGKDASGRLWSAVTIIGGVSTAVAAAISAGVTLLLRSGALS